MRTFNLGDRVSGLVDTGSPESGPALAHVSGEVVVLEPNRVYWRRDDTGEITWNAPHVLQIDVTREGQGR